MLYLRGLSTGDFAPALGEFFGSGAGLSLVERGVALPSNLQGLYEVRYDGNELDHSSTMALLEAFAGFKSVA